MSSSLLFSILDILSFPIRESVGLFVSHTSVSDLDISGTVYISCNMVECHYRRFSEI